jgi:hypothetical protein
MMTHELKTWPKFFTDLGSGRKRFELRPDDRGFEAGDVLILREWMPGGVYGGCYTGRTLRADVTYVLRDARAFGLRDGFCAMSLKNVEPWITRLPDGVASGEKEGM